MADDLQWRVDVEITRENASAFRLDNRTAAPLSKTVWVAGTLSLLHHGRLRLVIAKDHRLSGRPAALTVAARQSVADGVAVGTKRLLWREIQLWRQSTMVRILIFNKRAQELFAVIGYAD